MMARAVYSRKAHYHPPILTIINQMNPMPRDNDAGAHYHAKGVTILTNC